MEALDINNIKAQIASWILKNPTASQDQLRNYCEEIIPPNKIVALKWLVDCSVNWHSYLRSKQVIDLSMDHDDDQDIYDLTG